MCRLLHLLLSLHLPHPSHTGPEDRSGYQQPANLEKDSGVTFMGSPSISAGRPSLIRLVARGEEERTPPSLLIQEGKRKPHHGLLIFPSNPWFSAGGGGDGRSDHKAVLPPPSKSYQDLSFQVLPACIWVHDLWLLF